MSSEVEVTTQYYATNKKTGKVYGASDRAVYPTKDGLKKAIKYSNKVTTHWHNVGMLVDVCGPPEDWDIKAVELK